MPEKECDVKGFTWPSRPGFRTLVPDEWLGMCGIYVEYMNREGFFKSPPFCKKTGDATAICALMTANSQPRVLSFRLAPDRPSGLVLERIERQRRKADEKAPPIEDDDDLPM